MARRTQSATCLQRCGYDLFMKRVESEEMWSLMCPNGAPGSAATTVRFEDLYTKYESEAVSASR